jgi:hypothetical protein
MRASLKLSLGLMVLATALDAAAAPLPPSERAKVEGFVVLRMAQNGVDPYTSLVVERTDDGRNAIVTAGIPHNPTTYAGWLDPGTYRFLRFSSTSSTGLITTYGGIELEPLQLPTFKVAAGELVDLGTWLQQGVGTRVLLALLSDPQAFGQGRHHEELAEAAAAFPDPATRWVGAEVWIQGPPAGEVLEASKRATEQLKPPQFDEEGNAYFASSLGQVLRRTPQGAWRNLDTGSIEALSSIYVDGSNIYASTEYNRLLSSSDGGATWKSADVPAAETVTAIGRLPNGDFVVATEATQKNPTQLLRGPDLLALPSTPWITLDVGRTSRFEARSTAIAGPIGGRLIVWTAPRSLNFYDIATDRWTSMRAKAPLAELYVNGDLVYSSGPLASQGLVEGLRLNDGMISADGGKTWLRTGLSLHNGVGFRDRKNGIAVRVGSFARATTIETTKDGGTTWERLETDIPGFCIAAQYLPPTDELVCMSWSGHIQSTRTGEDWRTERSGIR